MFREKLEMLREKSFDATKTAGESRDHKTPDLFQEAFTWTLIHYTSLLFDFFCIIIKRSS